MSEMCLSVAWRNEETRKRKERSKGEKLKERNNRKINNHEHCYITAK